MILICIQNFVNLNLQIFRKNGITLRNRTWCLEYNYKIGLAENQVAEAVKVLSEPVLESKGKENRK
jgi:hypothetical protein